MTIDSPALSKGKATFHHSAANWAVAAVLAPIVLNIIGGGVDGDGRRYISLLGGGIMLTAIPAGVIALSGIRKHGTKGLLLKGLFGLLMPILLTAIAVPAFLKVRENARAKAVANFVQSAQHQLPMEIDSMTRMTEVKQEGSGVVAVHYVVRVPDKASVDMDVWGRDVRPLVRNGFAATAFARLTKSGVLVKFRYTAENEELVDELVFEPEK